MLSGREIAREVTSTSKRIIISPFNPKYVGPNSYDLTLAQTLKCYTIGRNLLDESQIAGGFLDPKVQNETVRHLIPEDGIILLPNQLYLGHTVETAGSDYYIPCIEGRSSIARLGVQIHMTAGFGDVGFIGQWTLEIQVAHPVKLYAGMRVCQIYFQPIVGEFDLYNGKYLHSKGVIASKINEDKELL